MTDAGSDARHIAAAQAYFRLLDGDDPALMELFTDDVEFLFPKFGMTRGKGALAVFAQGFSHDRKHVVHDTSNYRYLPSGSSLVVEGTTTGRSASGKTWMGGSTPGGRFCNVFGFEADKICSVHVYLDPDYTGEDAARFYWGVDGRQW